MRKVSIYTHATTISPQMSTAMVSLAFRSGTISSDIILWVLFLLSTALLSALVVHERDGIFFQEPLDLGVNRFLSSRDETSEFFQRGFQP